MYVKPLRVPDRLLTTGHNQLIIADRPCEVTEAVFSYIPYYFCAAVLADDDSVYHYRRDLLPALEISILPTARKVNDILDVGSIVFQLFDLFVKFKPLSFQRSCLLVRKRNKVGVETARKDIIEQLGFGLLYSL